MQALTPRPVAYLESAGKVYGTGDSKVVALRPTSLDVLPNELLLILGPSGSGKTTLLSLLGCVIYPSQGRVKIQETYTDTLNERELARLRLQKLGFIFQSFNLIAPLNVVNNVMLPLNLMGVPKNEAKERAMASLAKVGMDPKAHSLPRQLSGGQQQRVAVARALVSSPTLLLCDEPTASLDAKSAESVMHELKELASEGRAVAVVTHDLRLRQYADRTLYVADGECSFSPPTNDEIFH